MQGQLFGGLVRVSETASTIYLPKVCRIPLGFITPTSAHVALVSTSPIDEVAIDGRPPDLLVTVLNPSLWNSTRQICISRPDQPGLLGAVLERLASNSSINVALAETATVITASTLDRSAAPRSIGVAESPHTRVHTLSLICEHLGNRPDEIEQLLDTFSIDKWSGFSPPFRICGHLLKYFGAYEIRDGRIEMGSTDWRAWIRSNVRGVDWEQFQLDDAVATADSDSRILRFVFPRRGARNVEVKHQDKPGVLLRITEVIREAGVNILTALLRRGGAGANHSMLVATCEPTPKPSSTGIAIQRQPATNPEFLIEHDLKLRIERTLARTPGGSPVVDVVVTGPSPIPRRFAARGRERGVGLTDLNELYPSVIDELRNIAATPANGPRIFVSTGAAPGHFDFVDLLVRWQIAKAGATVLDGDQNSDGDPLSRDEKLARLLGASAAAFVLKSRANDDTTMKTIDLSILCEIGIYCQMNDRRPALFVEQTDYDLTIGAFAKVSATIQQYLFAPVNNVSAESDWRSSNGLTREIDEWLRTWVLVSGPGPGPE